MPLSNNWMIKSLYIYTYLESGDQAHSFVTHNSNIWINIFFLHSRVPPLDFEVPIIPEGPEDEITAPQNWSCLNCMVQDNGKPLHAYWISIFM